MAFVNEKISAEDSEKYDLKEINNRMNGLRTPTSQWTIDKESKIWVRHFYRRADHTEPDGGYKGKDIWDYCWKGQLFSIETYYVQTKPQSGNNGTYYADIQILTINIPEELIPQKTLILQNLKQAFIVYAGGGIYSKAISCDIDLEYKGELI